jgi:hypothetical protein
MRDNQHDDKILRDALKTIFERTATSKSSYNSGNKPKFAPKQDEKTNQVIIDQRATCFGNDPPTYFPYSRHAMTKLQTEPMRPHVHR